MYSPYNLKLEEVRDPEPYDKWVKIRVERVGICGTDKAFYKGTYKPGKLPLIPGHEIAGVVCEVYGKELEHILGLKVTTEINISCEKCWFCVNDMRTHCPYRNVIGITIDGGMAEYMLTHYKVLHSIEGLSAIEGVFVEPLAAVLEMIKLKPPKPRSNIAIIGAGTVGLLSLQILRLYAPRLLVVIAREGSPKEKVAKRLGADYFMDYKEASEFLSKTPEKQGFDYVVEASGSPEGLEEALNIVRPRGIIAAKSTHGVMTSFNYTLMVVKEITIVGSRCGPFNPAIKLLKEKLVRIKELITHEYSLKKGEEAFKVSLSRSSIKVHIIP